MFCHGPNAANRDVETLLLLPLGCSRRRRGDGERAHEVVVQRARVVVAHVAVSFIELVFEAECRPLAGSVGDTIGNLEGETGDGWCEGGFCDEARRVGGCREKGFDVSFAWKRAEERV